ARRRLLAVIRADFDRIHASYRFQPQEMIPVPGHPDVVVPYAELLVFERAGVPTIPKVAGDEVLTLNVKGRTILGGPSWRPI
ncbi:MAG TPA: hypothetical protein VFG47_23595, partial [Geminicoccaceae bacterium]|nr:hypothetical protein [Geminicoccaceae bacterium]